MSSTVLQIGPARSKWALTGIIPALETVPRLALMVHKLWRVAGQIKEPVVCVPTAIGANPVATAIALPEEEPPGLLMARLATMIHEDPGI